MNCQHRRRRRRRVIIVSFTALAVFGGAFAGLHGRLGPFRLGAAAAAAQAQDLKAPQGSMPPKGSPPLLLPSPVPGLPAVLPLPIKGRAPSYKERSLRWGGWCGTPAQTLEQKNSQRRDITRMLQRLGRRSANRTAGSVIVPVYVHVISKTDGTGNVPDSWIHAQIKTLNMAYSGRDTQASQFGQGPSAQPTANTPFRFVLGATRVTQTPNGTPIAGGISRTVNNAWHDMEDDPDDPSDDWDEFDARTALKVGRAGTLNIYICNPGVGLLGYAYYPFADSDTFVYDGAVILHSSLPGASGSPYNYGDTTVHEVGHWLGLEHTFEGGCNADSVNGGDMVADTPAEREPYYGRVPPTPDSCTGFGFSGRDPVENFMDYTDDDCMFQFTAGQSARADTLHALYRSNQ